jgi:hypothetical protein
MLDFQDANGIKSNRPPQPNQKKTQPANLLFNLEYWHTEHPQHTHYLSRKALPTYILDGEQQMTVGVKLGSQLS